MVMRKHRKAKKGLEARRADYSKTLAARKDGAKGYKRPGSYRK